jgi:TolA-binding protein
MPDVFGLLNLIARSRRQNLTAAERWQLERAVESSAALRSIQQASRDFAALAEVRPGDDELIDRAVTRALTCREHRRSSVTRRPPSAFMLTAAAMLIGASTAFGYWGIPKVIPAAAPLAIDGAKHSGAIPARKRFAFPPSDSSQVAARPVLPASTARGSSAALPARSRAMPDPSAQVRRPLHSQAPALASATVSSRVALDAATLFSHANAARRAKHVAEAIRTFRQLQNQFPQSSEAAVSHLSLGNLLLERGDAASALGEFTQVTGALAEEGLIGQARAYDMLGRDEDTRLIWTRLRERFPNSIYARPVEGESMGTSVPQSPK